MVYCVGEFVDNVMATNDDRQPMEVMTGVFKKFRICYVDGTCGNGDGGYYIQFFHCESPSECGVVLFQLIKIIYSICCIKSRKKYTGIKIGV